MAIDQVRWANRSVRRNISWIFFAIVMPVGVYALMAATFGQTLRPAGMELAFFFAVGMSVYGASVTAFINMPETVVRARDAGVLKRLRGTPLAPWQYLAGRTVSVLWVGLLTAGLVFAVAIISFGATIAVGGLPVALAVLVVGILTVAACGYALAAVAPNGRAIAVMGLAVLLPLSFLSDVFPFFTPPAWIVTVGSIFPLRHFVYALAGALNPAGPTIEWADLGVMVLWMAGAGLVAVRWFRWEPRH